ncbi:hypothetical protein Bbelb_184860 [Branchiostoma belcheri]|nr:hypothetical protein Bbelb_184860 [Branchiostoma belcheri]
MNLSTHQLGHRAWVDGVPFNSTALGGVTVRGDGGCTLLRKGRDTVMWESVSCSGETPTAHVICEKPISCSSDAPVIQNDCTCSTHTTTPARASTGPPAVAVSSTGARVSTEQNRRPLSSEATVTAPQRRSQSLTSTGAIRGTTTAPARFRTPTTHHLSPTTTNMRGRSTLTATENPGTVSTQGYVSDGGVLLIF